MNRDPADVAIGDTLFVYRSDTSEGLVQHLRRRSHHQDKLFVFGLTEGRTDSSDTFGRTTSTHTSNNNSPNAMLKLDWKTSRTTTCSRFTGIHNKSTDQLPRLQLH